MPLEAIETPKDILTTNQWTMEIDGQRIASLSSITGPTRAVGSIPRSDGGTGITYNFTNQKVTFGDVTLTRQRDPKDPWDSKLKDFVDGSMVEGTKYNGQLIKYHFRKPIFRIVFFGMLFKGENYPSLDKGSSGPFVVTYPCSVDFWEELPASL